MIPGDLTGMSSANDERFLRLRCQLASDDRFGGALSMRVILEPAYVDDYPGRVHFGQVASASDVVLWDSGGQEQ